MDDAPTPPQSGAESREGTLPTPVGSRSTLDDIRDREIRIEDRGRSTQNTIMWTGITVALITAVYAFFSYEQWQEMIAANGRTDAALAKTDLNLRIATKALREMNEQTNIARSVKEASDRGAAEQKVFEAKLLAQTSRQADIAEKAYREASRAKVVMGVVEKLAVQAKNPLCAVFALTNPGQGYAQNVVVDGILVSGEVVPEKRMTAALPLLIGPGQAKEVTLCNPTFQGEKWISDVSAGGPVFLIQGTVQYDDQFNEHHSFEFCEFFDTGPAAGAWQNRWQDCKVRQRVH